MRVYAVYAILTVILPFLALIYDGIERKMAARLQGRVGPPITQSWLDFIKLLTKHIKLPEGTNLLMLLTGLLLMLGGSLVPLIMVFCRKGDLILLMYLMVGGTVGILLVGLAFKSPYSRVGVSREMQMAFLYELSFIMAIVLYMWISGARSIDMTSSGVPALWRYPLLIIPLILLMFVVPAKVGVVPVDIGEAESEIAEGPFVEVGGGYLAMVKLTRSVKMLAILQLISVLFFIPSDLTGVWYWVLSLVLDVVLMFLLVSVVRNAASRIRIDHAVRFYATVPTLVGVLGLILVYVLGR